MKTLFNTDRIDRDATLSADGRYRWTLSRCWDPSMRLPWCGWIMLNPSTADAEVDDRTIGRCMGFARSWGYGGITVVNLFGLISTDPAELRTAAHPVAPPDQVGMHDDVILGIGTDGVCPVVVAAWGVDGVLHGRDRHVARLYREAGVELHCLGTTKDGHPRHPLYLPATQQLEPFVMRRDT